MSDAGRSASRDVSQSINLPERVTNGTFDTDISGWTDNSESNGSIAWDSDLQAMDITAGSLGDNAIARQQITGLTAGTYEFAVTSLSGDFTLSLGTTEGGTDLDTRTVSDSTTEAFQFTLSGTVVWIELLESGVAEACTVDDVSLRGPL